MLSFSTTSLIDDFLHFLKNLIYFTFKEIASLRYMTVSINFNNKKLFKLIRTFQKVVLK